MDTINLDQLVKDLVRDEGFSPTPYRDSQGYLTIGVGHNLDAEGLCNEAIKCQLDYDIHTKAVAPLDTYLPWWRSQPQSVQLAMANLCFNLGIGKLLQFKTTLSLIQSGKYAQAGTNLMQTLYAKQVGQRAVRVAELIKSAQV